MKNSVIAILSGFALLAISCSSVKIAYDYDRQADFNNYRTYMMNQNDLSESVGQLNANRIIQAVEGELAAKGMQKSDSPDIIVDVHIKTQQQVQATATTTGAGGPWGYRYGGGFATTTVNYDEYTQGTLFVTMVDYSSEQIVWQGTGTKTFNEAASTAKREESIKYSVQQILKNYPPQQQ